MTLNNNPVLITYSDIELRNLVEEYLAQQKSTFDFGSVCSFILYWAIEDGKADFSNSNILERFLLQENDKQKVMCMLKSIVRDGRIVDLGDSFFEC